MSDAEYMHFCDECKRAWEFVPGKRYTFRHLPHLKSKDIPDDCHGKCPECKKDPARTVDGTLKAFDAQVERQRRKVKA
jgi:hypothetical protein